MNLKTLVHIKKSHFEINYQSNILSLGSCFSHEIAKKLFDLKYNVVQNPCGITFNPISILSCIKTCKSKDSLLESSLKNVGELYAHPDFHGSFNDLSPSRTLIKINRSINSAKPALKTIDTVLITLGTSWVYKSLKTGDVVNNCHKQPAKLFERSMLNCKQVFNALDDIKLEIEESSDKYVNFIMTLSPIRHIKDGLIDNQKSKATALVAIHDFVEKHDNVHYFPSYEILLDELRDYRYYKDDMIHPTPLAINYIYQLFEKHYLKSEDAALREKISKINLGLQHRPIHPDSKQHIAFKMQLLENITQLEKENSGINFDKEKNLLSK